MAFTQNTIATFAKQPTNGKVQLTTTSLGTAYTAGSNGSKIVGLFATSTDTSNQTLTVFLTNSTNFELVVTQIPLGSGTTNGVPPVNLLALITGAPIDNDGNPFLHLISGDTLTAQLGAITAAKHVNIHVVAADF